MALLVWRPRNTLIAALLLLSVSAGLVVEVHGVTSASMVPTVLPGAKILVLRTPFLFAVLQPFGAAPVSRGAIIVMRRPDTGELVLKRVVAFGGDNVRIEEGFLFVNGISILEEYAHHKSAASRREDQLPSDGSGKEFAVPANTIFVLGDNRTDSKDSRTWGAVPIALIVSRYLLSLR